MAESYDILGIDHEGGDLTGWTSEVNEGTCDVVVESSAPVHGSYSAKSVFDGTNNNAYMIKNFGGNQTEVYVRLYLYLNADFALSSGYFVPFNVQDSAGNPVCYLRCADTSLALERFYYRTDATTSYLSPSAFTFLVDTDYYIEYHFKQSSGSDDGIVELKINGTSYSLKTDVDNDTITAYQVCAGNCSTAVPTSSSTITFDDLIVNNATSGYPGVYSAGTGGFLNRNYWWYNLG